VETVVNGCGAVSRICDGGYDLVLLDYLLSEPDGLAIARLVRGLMGDAPRPRLIALQDIVLGRELAPGRVCGQAIGKPVDLPELLAIVTRYLRTAMKRHKSETKPPAFGAAADGL
jgi:CheY-like chemotaxis protein